MWLALAAQISCAGGPTNSDQAALDPEISQFWSEGQNALVLQSEQWARQGLDPIAGDVFSISPTRFHFVTHSEPLELLGEPVGGYFDANSRTIHYYDPMIDGAIQHEAGHAILFLLRDPRWRCVFHQRCG